ncbi:MlaD family protein [Lacibacter sediminis]|uniref:MCE family protein n=1 Tax=Lacibacter sediminis TaxID=2760713 RepID=A0A7G5XCX1_9BACT|nr:MlaD family protein [Lacibacter sediminis]QNA43324.1 MCE family protein [Lacibacter sediminis]
MDTTSKSYKIKLGLFIIGGLVLFAAVLFIIGKKNNLFTPVFTISAAFNNVSGLQVGNNIRFSGITIGTVDDIVIINDSTVKVTMVIKNSVKKFIKADSKAIIASDGIIGDKLVIISQGSGESPIVKEGQLLESEEPVETAEIMASLQITAANAEVITEQLAEVMIKVNSGNGTLGRLIQDPTIANNLSQTMQNMKTSSQGLTENMEAAKENFLLKGYFNRKKKAAAKKAADKKAAELKAAEEKKKG